MPDPSDAAPLTGPVEVIGAGLLGTSVALACRRAGLEVLLSDTAPDHVRTARALGAGRARTAADQPRLVVVAVPPAQLGTVIAEALVATAPYGAVVTDVGSVKSSPLAEVAALAPAEIERYVGSHPMAGSERSGPLAASAALFDGRPWAVTAHPSARADAVAAVTALAELCGGVPVELDPAAHDRAVARTSHVPHLMSALVAARLADAPAADLALSGQGVRDVTRVAAGDPRLYGQIVAGNADAVVELLGEVRAQLEVLIRAIGGGDRTALQGVLAEAVAGTRAIPGKHGAPDAPSSTVYVAVPDHPGELARLFADVGEIGVNIEDVRMDHDPGRQVGLAELVVTQDAADRLETSLESRGWVTHR
ncbi:MAG: prephenate dehydrogenase [Nocardioides sp.]|uniref:prephenate dehydrogenase n=1 Tax=Nocardioides sp. TaxID=35761 RepID=UPI0039E5B70B